MPAQQDFSLYEGDDWSHQLAIVDDGGRYIEDARIVNLNNQISSAKGGFTDDDINTTITVVSGGGVPDGTTIIAVASDGFSATMSTNASQTRKKVRCITRASNLANYTFKAEVQPAAGITGTPLISLRIDSSRKAAGLLRLYLLASDTNNNTFFGVYDLESKDTSVTPNIVGTLLAGNISVSQDVTK